MTFKTTKFGSNLQELLVNKEISLEDKKSAFVCYRKQVLTKFYSDKWPLLEDMKLDELPGFTGERTKLRKGDEVTVYGLEWKWELNGLTGQLGDYDIESDRWWVSQLGSRTGVKVRTVNLVWKKWNNLE